ncbi:MAG: transketolase C-terminal domain-containing protein [Solirubrobacteraceae bacterium]
MSQRYVPLAELRRIRELEAEPHDRAAAFADACRLNALYMIARAGSGHIGTSFSCLDILAWLHLEVVGDGDRCFSSKGHDAPGTYAVLAGTEKLPFELIHGLRRLGGLPGHPDVVTHPVVQTSTGSLGMGVSKAKGFVTGDRLVGRDGRVYVITGDGELQEGQFWESLASAANRRMGEITAIVDHNKLQSDTWVDQVCDLGDLRAKAGAWGWVADRCDGHDLRALDAALARLEREAPDTPKFLIADTVKGAGVSFMEPRELPHTAQALYGFHSGAPSEGQYEAAVAELEARLRERLEALDAPPVRLEPDGAPWTGSPDRRRPSMSGGPTPGGGAPPGDEAAAAQVAPMPDTAGQAQRLVPAYAAALEEMGEAEPRLVVLDADLVLDCGLIPFRDRFPQRFIECGIAEQDMVSQAGTLALSGLLPAAHSFACFLTPRANEQIYNNATEGTKVIYTGSLVGLVPAGPGHSHQSVRDIAAMGAMPGMSLIEPHSEAECRAALRWAVQEAAGPVYIRLVSVPWPLPFDPDPAPDLVPGRGTVLREGSDALLVAAGPVMVSSAWLAADELERQGQVRCTVAALPWLRGIDGAWLAELAGDGPVVCLDNHYPAGGQGDGVTAALAAGGHQAAARVRALAVETVPACGGNDEVLRAHRLDPAGVAAAVREAVGGSA